MKETFAGVRAAYFEQNRVGHSVVRARLYRWAGRMCLLGAAVSGSVEIFGAGQGNTLPLVTLRSLFGLSPDVTAPSLQPLKVAIEFVVGSPLWIVLLVAAAIPYALAVQLFIKEKPIARMGERR
jgi:hypothetical protein